MIISINGWPGTGKLTVGTLLAKLLDGRLLDNHTMFNLAITLSDTHSDAYYRLCRAVRTIAFDHVLELPPEQPLVITGMIARGGIAGFAEEHWASIIELCERRGSKLYSVTLRCSHHELAKRVVEPSRALNKKTQDDEIVLGLAKTRELFDEGADHALTLDNTSLPAEECADRIHSWIVSSEN